MEFTDTLTDSHCEMMAGQSIFFTATAAADGRINLSPKGYDTVRVLSPTRVAYLDLGGSGNETQAHLNADGRITLMFCNFQQPALILRIYGHGRAVLAGEEGWDALAGHFDLLPGTRQIFDIAVDSVQTSCGWGVPVMAVDHERRTLVKYHAKFSPDEWVDRLSDRTTSIDGLPVRPPERWVQPTMTPVPSGRRD